MAAITSTKFTTESSIWTIDADALVATRLPRTEDPSHPDTSYDVVGHPDAIDGAHVVNYRGGIRLCIHGHPTGGPLLSGVLVDGPTDFVAGDFDCPFG